MHVLRIYKKYMLWEKTKEINPTRLRETLWINGIVGA
jgi:hypothetical protein